MIQPLQKYIRLFKNLRVDRTHGVPAPHKPVLLLSILQMYQNGKLKDDKIFISPELISLFKANWSLLVVSNHTCNIAYPFYHLKSSTFWKLIPKNQVSNLNFRVSLSNLNALVECAVIADDLFNLALNYESNTVLSQILLNEFFPQTKDRIVRSASTQEKLFSKIEDDILHESPAKYTAKMKKLIEQEDEEEVFMRGGLFKREIPKIYNYTCCISGMRIESTLNVSMIDACHIVPFCESYDDTITNGIALCPNLHRAFDRGLISIDDNYRVLVSGSNIFKENKSYYSIKIFENKEMLLPKNPDYHPSLSNFEKHRNYKFNKFN